MERVKNSTTTDAKRKKLCWNCEGTVGYDAYYCPYCGSDVSSVEEEVQGSTETKPKTKLLEESLASLYKPPYATGESAKDPAPISFGEEEKAQKVPAGGYIWALLLLSVGSVGLTLGLLLLFFSDHGRVVLQWNAHYWFLYCLFSAPLLTFGWRFLNHQ